jgi:hypothetical protein
LCTLRIVVVVVVVVVISIVIVIGIYLLFTNINARLRNCRHTISVPALKNSIHLPDATVPLQSGLITGSCILVELGGACQQIGECAFYRCAL